VKVCTILAFLALCTYMYNKHVLEIWVRGHSRSLKKGTIRQIAYNFLFVFISLVHISGLAVTFVTLVTLILF